MARIAYWSNIVFAYTLVKLGIISTEVTWCRLYESKYVPQQTKKPVYFMKKSRNNGASNA